MNTILLLALNARYSHTNLAVRALRAACSLPGWQAAICESSINQSIEAVVAMVAAEAPRALGISVYIWNSIMIQRLLPLLKERLPGMTIILGGPEVSYQADRWLADCPAVDYIVSGPGEAALAALLSSDLAYPERVITVPAPPLDELPFPYTDEDLASLSGRYIYYESSRGCPFRCSFCLSSRDDQAVQFRNTALVMSELDLIMRHRPGTIKFVDRSFNIGGSRFRELWHGIIAAWSHAGTIFHFEINPSLLTDEDFTLLASCPPGLFQFEMGMQSVNPETLAAIDRRQGLESALRAIGRLTALGTIHTHVDLIAGLPYDTLDTIARGLDEVMELAADHCQLGFLKLLPGTAMSERREEYGMTADVTPPYQVRQTRWLAAHELRHLESLALLVDRCCNTGHFPGTLPLMRSLTGSWYRLFSLLADLRGPAAGALTRSWEDSAALLLAGGRSLNAVPAVRAALVGDWLRMERPGAIPAILHEEPRP